MKGLMKKDFMMLKTQWIVMLGIFALISIFILPSILLVCERFCARTSHGWPKTGAAGKSKQKPEESI